MKRVAIVGFGLIGGSLALSLKRATTIHVTAIDRSAVVMREEARAAADELVDIAERARAEAAMADAELTVLSTPVGGIIELLPWCLANSSVVTDCGSTKRQVCQAAARAANVARFVAGHPMAGRPEGGIENAEAELFDGRTWILCPEGAAARSLEVARELVALSGAKMIELSADAHDRAVAVTSHLPQVLASALSVLAEPAEVACAKGPAFERATRTAGGAESMWRDIFETNSDELARAIEDLGTELAQIARGLRAAPADVTAALALLARARGTRREPNAESSRPGHELSAQSSHDGSRERD